MADNDFRNAFAVAYADGPTSAPYQPDKSIIRNLGPLIDAALAALASLIGSGIQWKEPVSLATTANITLSGEQEIDGVVTSASRILVKSQTNPAENGLYISGAGAWTRSADSDSALEVKGMAVFVRGGATNKGRQYVCFANGVIVLGTTALPFIEISDQTALNAAIADLQAAVDDLQAAALLVDNITKESDDWDLSVQGFYNYPVAGVFDDDWISGYAGKSADLAALSMVPVLTGYSKSLLQPSNSPIARPFWEYNLILGYGQSLASAQEAWEVWVANDTAIRTDTWMVGNAVQPQSDQNPAFVPYGSTTLVPLKSTVSNGVGTIYTAGEVAALPSGNDARGFASVVSATRYAARAFEDSRLSYRQWVAMEAGSSGKTIEELSPGNTPAYYNRFTEALTAFSAAVPSGDSKGVAAILFKQGEFNYSNLGGDRTKNGYKSKLIALKDAMNASVASALTLQGRQPVGLIYQTGGQYVLDDTTTPVSIGQAQWEASLERDDIVMVGPVYPLPDKGGHLTADGSAWYGEYEGKVFDRVVNRGERWEPVSPLWVKIFGRTIYIGYHVPSPPLVFGTPYVVTTPRDYRDKGFRVQDMSGFIPIDRVRILGGTIVAIDIARLPNSLPEVMYGTAVFNGGGCVRDSDSTVSSGTYRSTDIPALTGAPYPLHNWSIAFTLPAIWTRLTGFSV